MKKYIFFGFFLFATSCIHAQNDTLFTTKGNIGCDIKEVALINIKYQFPNETLAYNISPMEVSKIKFKSGRVQQLSNTEKYPEEIKTDFINSCTAKGSVTKAYCECTFEKIQSKFSLEDFSELSQMFMNEDTKKDVQTFFIKLALYCQAELKQKDK